VNENDLASWQGFAAAQMGAAAALLGLFFVAMSIHLRQVMASPELRGRARGCIAALFLQLLVGLAVLVPGQPDSFLGAELLAAGSFNAWISVRRVVQRYGAFRPVLRYCFSPNGLAILGFLLVAIAGVAVISGGYGGLRWLPLACAVLFFYVILGSWALLAGAAEVQA